MRRRSSVLFAIGALTSCAPTVPPAIDAACYACDELEAPAGDEDAAAASRAVSPPAQPEPRGAERWDTRRIGGGSDVIARRRPPRRPRVDLQLLRAPFDDVARLLSDAGRFDIVLSAPAAREVTVSLRDVEPFEALELIAEAQGLSVRYERGVVVVSP